ncbi:FISUMP domain-containing protein [Flammeovirga sp. EKP202]|uniref:FISUMP domain-containing protein n=1 Tax=Flammeovirga sp. EKP202 TaxID=2770592 RepID=UPI001660022A|nr:FISUMP domain-containing protein [Flammeovirga sp. EKP202]MBD0400793.1 hypothetical protein [Flammeovirga sp. EKP202]
MKNLIRSTFIGSLLACSLSNCTTQEETPALPTPNAGGDQLELANYGYETNIGANELKENQSGRWRIVRGENGEVTEENAPNTIFKGEPGELYTLEWELSSGEQYKTDWMDISFKALENQIYSTFEDTIRNNFKIQLHGDSTKYGEVGTWSIVSEDTSGYFENIHDPKTAFVGQPNKTYTLEWKHVYGSKEAKDEMTVHFDSLKAFAGEDQIGIVTKEAPHYFTLQAHLPGGASGSWKLLSGEQGTIVSPTVPNSLFNGILNEEYTLEWTVEKGEHIDKDTVTLSFGGLYTTWTDTRDNKTYKVIRIGDQEWFAENFDFEFYTGQASWYYGQAAEARINTGAPLTTDEERKRYGRLYTYVGASLATPEGWRLPTYEDYWTLVERFNGQSYAGDSFREGGDSGLNLIMGGFFEPQNLRYDPHFGQIDQFARYWVALEEGESPETSLGSVMQMNETPIVGIAPINTGYAVSVRYVRDVQK